jgi:hypothetical protein
MFKKGTDAYALFGFSIQQLQGGLGYCQKPAFVGKFVHSSLWKIFLF